MKAIRGQTLVASLIVIVIMCILAVVLLRGSGAFGGAAGTSNRKDGLGTTTVGAVKYAAKDDVCMSNLRQVRMSIQINRTSDDAPPASLNDCKLPKSFLSCPVGHEPYDYDPATGDVHCVHPGHEKY
jgi:hypothetical protein